MGQGRTVSSPDAHPTQPEELADVFAEVARALLAEDDLPEVLTAISVLAVETIGGADHCGITVVRGREVSTPAAGDEIPVLVDQIQYDTGQGPCLDAIREHEVLHAGDIGAEHARWPEFAPRAVAETPVRSVLSFRLFTGGETMGAMNMYADRVHAFDEEDAHVGSVFAAHAAVAMSSSAVIDNLRTALTTRDVIATAKGILMGSGDLTEDEAFDQLRRTSQDENTKLRDIAQRIVDRRGLPDGVSAHRDR